MRASTFREFRLAVAAALRACCAPPEPYAAQVEAMAAKVADVDCEDYIADPLARAWSDYDGDGRDAGTSYADACIGHDLVTDLVDAWQQPWNHGPGAAPQPLPGKFAVVLALRVGEHLSKLGR